jgi:hypothetical protein
VGAFYTNLTLRGPSAERVVEAIGGRRAFVSRTEGPCTVVLDQACESQNTEILSDLASQLSTRLSCPVFAVLIHDDDVLYFELWNKGRRLDQYNSCPGYFDDVPDGDQPSGGDAAVLAKSFEVADATTIESILRRGGKDKFVVESERHQELVDALGIPDFAVGVGYNYAKAGDFPPGVQANTFFLLNA